MKNPIARNIIAVLSGIILGTVANGAIIMLSGFVVPLPEGIDPNDQESLTANMHLLQPQHFLMPFLAHALGTLVTVLVAVRVAATAHKPIAIGLGIYWLLMGSYAAMVIPAPQWFVIADLALAYLPMAWLGYRLMYKHQTL